MLSASGTTPRRAAAGRADRGGGRDRGDDPGVRGDPRPDVHGEPDARAGRRRVAYVLLPGLVLPVPVPAPALLHHDQRGRRPRSGPAGPLPGEPS
ncbi:hypothetical protein L7F22_008621 [Adiantum nelumboides]|nr:hypothetical protein [Adiantum nelumboides]